ncbi:fanconi anemia group F protein (FANCF) isoform X1 [Carex rostrata]
MAWSHPDISIDDLLSLIKAFVDMLVLASGYQSSGLTAKWDPQNVTKAIRWGLFFEHVLKGLRESSDYEGSVKELDAALAELASDPLFPKGLGRISSETLSEARMLVIEHFLNSNPLSVSHLSSLFGSAIEMDRDYVYEVGNHSRRDYFEKLTAQMECLNLIRGEEDMSNGYSSINEENPNFVGQLPFLIEKISRRRELVSCMSSCGKVLDSFVNSYQELNPPISPGSSEMIEELLGWKEWRTRCLSYMLNKRTIKIQSGANLIFAAPKEQWMKVFEHLIVSSEENFLEVMEICLLGLVVKRWNSFVEVFTSNVCDFVPVSAQFSKLCNLFQGNRSECNPRDIIMDFKEKDILDYVMMSLTRQLHKLWQIPAILFSASIPPWCPLFKIYMSELEKLFDGTSSTIRCNCTGDENQLHQRCEIGERIRCLFIFHFPLPNA